MELNGLPPVSLPMPWHGQEWARLTEQLDNDELPHALLLVGGQYSGKGQLALALSRLLLCAHAEGKQNCGVCHACELSASGSHGDFMWVQPEDKSRVIKIDQVREVVRFTSKTAGFGACKVIVFAPADSMNVAAFNALLKSLEEPAKDTHLILVCNRLHGVPATIRSRCQILRTAMPDAEASLDWLDSFSGSREESQKLLTLATDRPLLAKQIYDTGSTEEFTQRQVGLRALLQGKVSVSQAGALWAEADVSVFLEQLSSDLQQILRSCSTEKLCTAQARAAFDLLDEIGRLQQAVIAGANPGKQLLLDSLMLKIQRELGMGLLGDNIQTQGASVNE